jgi:hypothetical protein
MPKDDNEELEPDELFGRWKGHVVRLGSDVVAVHVERQMFKELVDAIEKRAGETPATWRNHYARLYLAGQSMALRRVVRGDDRDVSLKGLLKGLAAHPEIITVDRLNGVWAPYASSYPVLLQARKEHFARQWGDAAGEQLDPDVPRRDLDQLFRDLRATLTWADKTIAHIPKDDTVIPYSFDQLDDAIETTTEVFKTYRELITGSALLPEAIALPWWQRTFDRPLFDS